MSDRIATSDGLPAAEGSIDLLRRAGWTTDECGVHRGKGEAHWLVSAVHGDNRIQVEGETRSRAWHRAVKMAEASGMLEG
jgi:hypothetical protein